MNFMVASVLSSWYSSWDNCSGYFTTWLGVFPLEIVTSGAMVSRSPQDLASGAPAIVSLRWLQAKFHCSAQSFCFILHYVHLALQVANSLFMFPMHAGKSNPGVQALLQGFVWNESTRKEDLAKRNSVLALYVKVSK